LCGSLCAARLRAVHLLHHWPYKVRLDPCSGRAGLAISVFCKLVYCHFVRMWHGG
jgi:hypothetical protein